MNTERITAIEVHIRRNWKYDPESGIVTNRRKRAVGTQRKDGALHCTVILPCGTTAVLMHRVAWFIQTGTWPIAGLDHRDGVKSHNWWTNLRPATQSQNRQNLAERTAKGRLRGTTFRPAHGDWRAQIRPPGGTTQHIGVYPTEEAAHEAYCAAKRKLHTFQPEQRKG